MRQEINRISVDLVRAIACSAAARAAPPCGAVLTATEAYVQRDRRRVVRMIYEVVAFQALRDQLKCKEIWVVGTGSPAQITGWRPCGR
ncbi:hypothetical protein [Streptomyces sp. H27-C3]|uniref:hypothetical protein n=1 Tax=Streptomyces sp. H27-C3 TaxID=3046305 RepID=UPI0024B9DDE7|nr:hypothetical protein [Streptomyces sp. H27-C3]MDJ0467057.1 hypothetical protein [Streptomyces sp. H27-C3]